MLIPATILVSIVLAFISIFLFKKSHMGKGLMQRGTEADAIILSVQLTGQYVKSDPQVIIQLQVEPDREKNFIADTREILNFHDFSLVQPGAKLRVKYNPYNHKEVSIIKKTAVAHTGHLFKVADGQLDSVSEN
jgi:hypothetical protein